MNPIDSIDLLDSGPFLRRNEREVSAIRIDLKRIPELLVLI